MLCLNFRNAASDMAVPAQERLGSKSCVCGANARERRGVHPASPSTQTGNLPFSTRSDPPQRGKSFEVFATAGCYGYDQMLGSPSGDKVGFWPTS